MRNTKRNIARKTKANRTTPAKRKTETFASAEGHNHHSDPTEPHKPIQRHIQSAAIENRNPGANVTPGASEAPHPLLQLNHRASEAMRPSPQGGSIDSPGRSEHSERQPGEEIASEAKPPQPPLAQNAPGAKVDEPHLELHYQATIAQDGFVPSSTRINPLPASAGPASPRVSHAETAIDRTIRNRQNAQNSTGPRTAEGKAASSRNALKHGLSIQRHVILDDEDLAEYEQLLGELREIYEPRSRREDLSVEDIAQCRWALQRFDEAEAVALEKETSLHTQDPDEPATVGEALGYIASTLIDLDRRDRRVIQPDTYYPTFEKIQRYRGHWDRRHHRALAEFDRAQRASRAEAAEERKQAEERRRQELHELKVALAQTKLAEAQARTAAKQAKSEEAAFFQALEQHLNTPPPGLPEDEPATLGFVSSDQSETNTRTENRAHNQDSRTA